jgi:predicted house-cleaning noncanonical NTP pyrophosphatase (MazG superfamily)
MENKRRRFIQNKLWRDKAVDSLERAGSILHWSRLDDASFDQELRAKLLEEAHEVVQAKSTEEVCGELADVMEVITTLCQVHNITLEQVQLAQQKKRGERGGFDGRKYVTIADHPDGSFGTQYCLASPDKYPEVDPTC